jgi:hypothetical protein
MGWREVRTIRTQVLRLYGQYSGGPSGVSDQSFSRMRALSSLFPENRSSTDV